MENNHYGVQSSIEGRNQFFMKVYGWMFGGIAISAVVAYLFSTTPALFHGSNTWIWYVGNFLITISSCIFNAT